MKVNPVKPKSPKDSPASDSSDQDKLDKGKIVQSIGTMHNNLAGLLRGKKFAGYFAPDYAKINNRIKKQLRVVNKDEKKTKSYLDRTKKNIQDLKANQRSNPLLNLLLGGLTNIMFASIGVIFLISLAREAFENWKKEYVPETDPETGKIFGIEIPGLAEIKAYAWGLWNFMKFGVPKYYQQFTNFFGGIYDELFGKKGCIRDLDQIKVTLTRIVLSWVIGQTKEIGGSGIAKLLKMTLKLAKYIPGWGTAIAFLCEIAPQLYSFIMNMILQAWQKNQASKDTED